MKQVIKLPAEVLPLCLTAIVMCVFFAVFWIAPQTPPDPRAMLPSEFLKQYEYTGSYDQRLAFSSALFAVFAASIVAFVVTKTGFVKAIGRRAIPTVNIWLAIVVAIAGLLLYRRLVPHWITNYACVLVAAFSLFAVFAPQVRRRAVEIMTLILIGAYLSIVVVPGLLTWPIPLLVSEPDSVAQIEHHLLALVQPGSAIASGQRFFREIPLGYGLLMPSLLSVIDARLGPLNAGDHARFVQYCQVVFTLTAAAAYLCYRPRNYLGVLAALLVAAPYWASAGLGIWHPNQTGMRSLTYPLGILALMLAGRFRADRAGWILGAVGMIAVLINLETASAVGAGYLVYLGLRTRSLPYRAILQAMAAGIAIFVAYLVVYRIALGRLPFGSDLASILISLRAHVTGDIGLRLFTPGTSGENYYVVAFAFVMLAHASYVVIAAFRDLARHPLSHRRALRAAIAVMLIIWFGYYFNLPNWWQIWTHLFLYGFLLIDLVDLRLLGVGRARIRAVALPLRRMRMRAAHAVPLFFVAIMIPHTNGHLRQYMTGFMQPPWVATSHEASIVSGLLVPRSLADALNEKAKKLLELKAETNGKVRYLTYNVEFIPMLTRMFEPTPTRALWGSVYGDDALDPAIEKVFAARPAVILVDAPIGPLAVSGARKEFQDRVRRSVLRQYDLAETVAGWEIYRPASGR